MAEFEPDHLRLYLLSEHYRTDADYTTATSRRSPSVTRASSKPAARPRPVAGDAQEPVYRDFIARLEDELRHPRRPRCPRRRGNAHRAGAAADGGAPVQAALSLLGFAFAGARGPATGDFTP